MNLKLTHPPNSTHIVLVFGKCGMDRRIVECCHCNVEFQFQGLYKKVCADAARLTTSGWFHSEDKLAQLRASCLRISLYLQGRWFKTTIFVWVGGSLFPIIYLNYEYRKQIFIIILQEFSYLVPVIFKQLEILRLNKRFYFLDSHLVNFICNTQYYFIRIHFLFFFYLEP